MPSFSWTGLRRDSSGKIHRTGFEASFLGVRLSTFTLPSRDHFDRRSRRFVIDVGPLHVLLTWR